MSHSRLLSRAVLALMLAVWTVFAATVEAQRLHKPPLLRGHERMQRVKVGSAAAGAMQVLMAALPNQPTHVRQLR